MQVVRRRLVEGVDHACMFSRHCSSFISFSTNTEMSLPTRMMQSAVIWTAGDLIAQFVQAHKHRKERQNFRMQHILERLDAHRVIGAALYGSLVFTPVASRWYSALQRLYPQTTATHIAKRVALDQLMWSPFALSMYFGSMALYNDGLTVDAFIDFRYKTLYLLPSTLVTNWIFWVPVQGLNFFFVSPARWLLVVNLAAIPWTAYLSSTTAE